MLNTLLRLERRARRQPKNGALQCKLAEVYLRMERRAAATEAIERAEQLVDGASDLCDLGRLLESIDAHDRAEAVYERLASSPEHGVLALLGRGRIALARGEASQAIRLFSQAVWMAPRDADCRCALARALIRNDRCDDAVEQLRQCLHVDARHAVAWAMLAEIGNGQGDLELEAEALRGGLRAPDPETSQRLAALLEQLGRMDEALAVLDEALRHTPSSELLCALGRCQLAANDPAALQTLEAAARHPDAPAEVVELLGLAQFNAGEHHRAIETFLAAFATGRRAPEVYCNFARVYVQVGQFAAAIDLLVRGLMQYRGDRTIETLLADVRGRAKQDDSGVSASLSGERPAYALEGLLRDFSVVDLLEFLRLNRRTGTLRLAAEQGVGEILLIEGNLAGVSSSSTPSLGELLKASGEVSVEQLDMITGTANDLPLGRRLVEDGCVTLPNLRNALRDQAQAAIAEILRWADGHFVFQASDSLRSTLTPEYELDTAQTLLDALRLMDERQAGHISE